MPSKINNPEAALAALIVQYLQEDGWDVYPEIQIRAHGGAADIVAVKGGDVLVVETKMTFGFAVMQQADAWKRYATQVAIGVPKPRNFTKARSFGQRVAYDYGIGIFTVDQITKRVTQTITPKPNPSADPSPILELLTPEHKTYTKAGAAQGKRLTTYKLTVNRLIEYVKGHQECSMAEAVKNIKHHYRNNNSARSALTKRILAGNIPELFCWHDSNKPKCYRVRFRRSAPLRHQPHRRSLDDF